MENLLRSALLPPPKPNRPRPLRPLTRILIGTSTLLRKKIGAAEEAAEKLASESQF
jgi:hypothetical protein